MLAYRVDGLMQWNLVYVAASIVMGIVFSSLAVDLAARRRTSHDRYLAIACLVAAIIGLHFTGMFALRILPLRLDERAAKSPYAWPLAIAVAGVAILVIGMGDVTYLIEVRITAKSDKRLRRMALYDYLTGLPNRAGFNEHLAHAVAAGGRIALITIDIDRFSEVNDLCGHFVGDEALKIYARRLSNALRVGDFAARLGADEFALIHRLRGEDDPKAMLEKLFQVFGEACISATTHSPWARAWAWRSIPITPRMRRGS